MSTLAHAHRLIDMYVEACWEPGEVGINPRIGCQEITVLIPSNYNKVIWLEQFVLVDRYGVMYINQSDFWTR